MADREPSTPPSQNTAEKGDANLPPTQVLEDAPFTALQNLAGSLHKPTTTPGGNNNNATASTSKNITNNDDDSIGDLTFDSLLTGSPAPFTPRRQISTPFRASTLRRRTPGGTLLPTHNPILTPGSTKPRQPPKSPHVIRAWETKRATTPGRERRRSLRRASHHYGGQHLGDGGGGERDSPMDILRKLSQIVAPTSRPYYLDNTPTQQPPGTTPRRNRRESGVVYYSEPEGGMDDDNEDVEDDDSPPPPPPRLSILADPDARLDHENEAFTRRPTPRISEIGPIPSPGKVLPSDLTPRRGRRHLSSGRRSSQFSTASGLGSDDDDSMLDADTTHGSIEHGRRGIPLNSRMSFGWDFRPEDRFQDFVELGVEQALPMLEEGDEGDTHMGDFTMDDLGAGIGEDSVVGGAVGLDVGDSTVDLLRPAGGMVLGDDEDEDMTDTINRDIAGLAEDSVGVFELDVPELEQDDSRDEDDTADESRLEEARQAGEEEEEQEDDDSDDGAGGEGFPDWEAISDTDDDQLPGSPTQEDTQIDPPDVSTQQQQHQLQQKSITTGKAPPPLPKPRSAASALPKPPPKLSKHGHPIPSLPPRVVKKLAQTFAGAAGGRAISGETLAAIMKASDAFFENISDSVGSFAEHAGRKTVFDSDVELLLRRQRLINDHTTAFSLAEKYLPRELLQEIKMPAPAATRGSKKKRQSKNALGGGGGQGRKKAPTTAAAVAGKGKGKAKAVEGDDED